MARDDYDVIAYKVLLYLYGCMKRKTIFNKDVFAATVRKGVDSDEYFASVLRLMKAEGLISGVTLIKAWGGTYIIASDLADMEITAPGIRYLKENSTMQRVKDALLGNADAIASLITLLGL